MRENGVVMLTLQQLVYFIEISKTLNYTRAAEKLYISQSSLSHQILCLERELQVSLFIRSSGKSVSVTKFGKKLLPYAEKVVRDMEEIAMLAKQENDPLSGVVNIAYSFINGYALVPDLFDGFFQNKKNENIKVEFDVTHNTRPTEVRILDGEIDLAFNCTKAYDGLETFPVAEQQLYCIMPVTHPLAEREKITIGDIDGLPLVHYHPRSELHHRIDAMFANAGCTENTVACYEDWFSQIAAITLGSGIGISPKIPFDSEKIKMIPLDDPLAKRTIYMLWAKGRELSAVAGYVRAHCMDWAGSHSKIY